MVTYEIPEYAEVHVALDAHDFDAYLNAADRLDDRVDAVSHEVFALAVDHGCVMLDAHGLGINDDAYTRRQYRQYLHRSTRYPGCLQLTSWDELGPICDVRIGRVEDLSKELRHSTGGTLWCEYVNAA